MDMKVYTAYTLSGAFATQEGIDHTMTWPNVTMPGFLEMTMAMPLLAHSWSIGFSPLVTADTRGGWEAYAIEVAERTGLNAVIANGGSTYHLSEHGSHGGHDTVAEVMHSDHSVSTTHAHGAAITDGDVESGTSTMSVTSDTAVGMAMEKDGAANGHGHRDRERRLNGLRGRRVTLSQDRRIQEESAMAHEAHGGVTDMAQDEDSGMAHQDVSLGEMNGNTIDHDMPHGMTQEEGSDMAQEGTSMGDASDKIMDQGMTHEMGHTLQDDTDVDHHGEGAMESEVSPMLDMEHEGGGGVEMTMDELEHHQDSDNGLEVGDMAPDSHHQGNGGDMAHSDEGHGGDEHTPEAQIRTVEEGIFRIGGNQFVDEDDTEGPYFPLWQVAPLDENAAGIMFNMYSIPEQRQAIDDCISNVHPTITDALLNSVDYHADDSHHVEPSSTLFYPVVDNHALSVAVGVTSISFTWTSMFMNILPSDVSGIVCVLESSAGQSHTFELNGGEATFFGEGDLHDKSFDKMKKVAAYELNGVLYHLENHHMDHRRRARCDETASGQSKEGRRATDMDGISYSVKIYPSNAFRSNYITNQPAIYASAIALVFVFTSLTFFIYDCLVERRQTAVMKSAEKSSKIVHSLFPAVVRDRLFRTAEEEMAAEEEEKRNKSAMRSLVPKAVSNIVDTNSSADGFKKVTVASFLGRQHDSNLTTGDDSTAISGSSPPIADLFTDTTILFADIAGFTAWSSEREPAQVFQLLEALFKEFDAEAKKYGVFKVETIGDCCKYRFRDFN